MADIACRYEDEGIHSSSSDFLYSGTHITNVMMIDKELLSSPDSNMVDTDLDQGTTTNVTSISSVSNTGSLDIKSIEDGINNNLLSIPVVHSFVNVSFESHGSNSNGHTLIDEVKTSKESPVLKDRAKRADDTANSNLSRQRCISLSSSTDNDVTSLPKKVLKHSTISTSSMINQKAMCCKIFIIFAICCIIGIFLIPIIVYYVNQTRDNTEVDTEYSREINTTNAEITLTKECNFSASNLDSNCMEQILYTYEALRTINLPSSQQYCSERVEMLFCNASMECSNESCVKDIVCQQVRQEYCTAEWSMLEVNQTDGPIDCTGYGETALLNCSDQFGYNGSICLPLCGEFSQYSEATTTPYIVLYATCLFTSIIGGITVIAFSFWKRKKMFHFPQILVPINAGNTIIINLLLSITTVSVGRWNILCPSKFLFDQDALDNPTTFCTVQGFVYFSGLVLYSYIWLLYIFHLALKLFFPLKSAKLSSSGYSRTIYIAEFLILLLIGTVPSIVSAVHTKYRISRFPPINCGGYDDRAYIFYSTTLPILAAVCVSIILMILILYKVHISRGVFKRKRKGSIGKQVFTCQFTIPEVKIGFVLLYWLILTLMIWTTASIRNGRDNTFASTLKSYTDCMAGGDRKDHDCHKLRLDLEAESNFVIAIIFLVMIAFLNFASLPFVIQFQTVKHTVRRATRRISATIFTRLAMANKFNEEENCDMPKNNADTS